MATTTANADLLGVFLKDRRAKLDPAALGFTTARRRTPGLRREEVAQRASISATWYTWLEQGRGGAPSAEVLERIAQALMLTDAEREHLFLLALGRSPDVRYVEDDSVTPRLQRVLDAFAISPAFVKTPLWDIVAWNRAATMVLTDYGKLPPERRNVLRLIFQDSYVREAQFDWEGVARFVVAAFRADVARAGVASKAEGLVAELCSSSADFEAMWRSNDVRGYGAGLKRLRHHALGPMSFEYSSFIVDGRPDLSLVVYNPATPEDADRLTTLMRNTPL
ncbi:helix-turn-helix transcriptional regulator [Luteibacter anthropi]|uniref:Helix-turn-helix domain-containing protein n=1 Tax=Luteibacter anthropi TaxID=564369 RepID=A0A7X5UAD1_9GAMM|nr:helix-turn-helix transcriptional regulator [Luteibacter anthropi]NII06760.1 helix-turn-helix domain-containing protein [Luteibacter anthropi]URX61563.1 helix-turn-helix transcriptional regulator [Luteibacter anthropi]